MHSQSCHVEQKLLTSPVFSEVRITGSVVFCVIFCRLFFNLLSLYFRPLYCLSCDIRHRITHLVSWSFFFQLTCLKYIVTNALISLFPLDLHLEIDNIGRLKIKLYDKRDDITFPIVNFLFISCNISAALGMEFIFHNAYVMLRRPPSTAIFWTGFICGGISHLKTASDYPFGIFELVALCCCWLKSSLRQFYGEHHELVDP